MPTEKFEEEELEINETSSQESEEEMTGFLQELSQDELEELESSIEDMLHQYLEDHFEKWANPDFINTMTKDVAQLLFQDLIDANLCKEEDEEEFNNYVKEYADFVIQLEDIVPRSETHTISLEQQTDPAVIQWILAQHQPEQRTPEWYEYRHNMITASNIWKAISSECQQNSLIYEKCQPQNQNIVYGSVNTSSPLHWGTKYETLSKMLYEELMQVKVTEFGCIQHPVHKFIGASPDGIVIDEESPLYGRMLEIKNIVNREIDGIPSLAYWVQMQVQMETCNLEACDFLETQICEYDDYEEFINDSVSKKGVVLAFVPTGDITSVQYSFMPLNIDCDNCDDIKMWCESEEKRMMHEKGYILHETKYWYLNVYSCVTVRRNRRWFESALPYIENIWNIVVKERESGCEHRAPKKRGEKKSVLQGYIQVNKLENNDVDSPDAEDADINDDSHEK